MRHIGRFLFSTHSAANVRSRVFAPRAKYRHLLNTRDRIDGHDVATECAQRERIGQRLGGGDGRLDGSGRRRTGLERGLVEFLSAAIVVRNARRTIGLSLGRPDTVAKQEERHLPRPGWYL